MEENHYIADALILRIRFDRKGGFHCHTIENNNRKHTESRSGMWWKISPLFHTINSDLPEMTTSLKDNTIQEFLTSAALSCRA